MILKIEDIVSRTWRKDLNREERFCNAGLGLIGECGEVVEHLKKHLFHGHKLSIEKIAEEMGDVYYYLCALEQELKITRAQVEYKLQEKLLKRYPNGFQEEKSKFRKE